MEYAKIHGALFAGVSMAAITFAGASFAQVQPVASGANDTGVAEVVVTATRQTSTVNRVSLSVAAVTQQALDQQGIKAASDLTRLVPGLNISQTGASVGVGQFAIRGIVGGSGAATTGVYLDDTALTKRANNGVQQNNGAPLPILFDLERVEVLKGPQGTLFGGSSQGGTVRFITPEPSLTHYSGLARAEANAVKLGEAGYEFGVAVGGPIVQDKLGFRVSVMKRRRPGWVDAVSGYTGQTVGEDVNRVVEDAIRGALKWQATDRLSFTLATYWAGTRASSQVTSPTEIFSPSAIGQLAAPGTTFTTPQVCLNTQTRNSVTQPIVAYNPSLPINSAPSGTPVQPAVCSATTPASARYIRPSFTYGPYNLGRDDALLTTQQSLTPFKTRLGVQTLTANYDLDHVNVKSITSYVRDNTHNESAQGSEDPTQRQGLVGAPTTATGALPTGFPLFQLIPDYSGHFVAYTERSGIQEEFRLSSQGEQRPFSWVAGGYFSVQKVHNQYIVTDRGLENIEEKFWGVTVPQRLGITSIPLGVGGVGIYEGFLDAHLKDTEVAGFAEANWYILEKLKLTGGVRISRVSLDYDQFSYGPNSSRYPNSAGSFVAGSTTNSPFTPKAGLTYEFTPNDLVYFNAAKGFRAGGVNAPVSPALCSTGLNQFGITFDQVPATYQPDSVWSYELGGKFRLLDNKLQVNGALYRIDWTNIQSTFTIPGCAQTFVQNGGSARSQGFDLQVDYRPVRALTLNMNLGYDSAKYLEAVVGPAGPLPGLLPSINAGDHFAVPNWQASVSANYEFQLFNIAMYVRGDYQWQSKYTGPGSFGVSVYNPYTQNVSSRSVLNARVGARFDQIDINIYANNLLDNRDKIGNAGVGVGGCPTTSQSCTGFTTYNPFVNQAVNTPRQIGVQANYRF